MNEIVDTRYSGLVVQIADVCRCSCMSFGSVVDQYVTPQSRVLRGAALSPASDDTLRGKGRSLSNGVC